MSLFLLFKQIFYNTAIYIFFTQIRPNFILKNEEKRINFFSKFYNTKFSLNKQKSVI
jgi:hypothetical protein